MDEFICSYRWEFRCDDVASRRFAEGELVSVGKTGDKTYYIRVYLVRDEMVRDPKRNPSKLIDPEYREGKRVYVDTVLSHEVRTLAHLAPVEGRRVAYPLIFKAVRDKPDAVKQFGDEWLSRTLSEQAAAR